MLTIIIGIIIAVGLAFWAVERIHKDSVLQFLLILALCIFIASLILGLFVPLSGYNDWELEEETELVSLSNSLGTQGKAGGIIRIYVSLSADNVYTYRYEIDSEFGTETSKEYKTGTVSKNVEEIEDPNCEIPVLRTYVQKAKRSVWTFVLDSSINTTKYVFYVPEGTISKEIKLD